MGSTYPGMSKPMGCPSCLLLQLMPGCRAQRTVGGNAREQGVVCLAGLGTAKVLDLTVGVRGLVCRTMAPDVCDIRKPPLSPLPQ